MNSTSAVATRIHAVSAPLNSAVVTSVPLLYSYGLVRELCRKPAVVGNAEQYGPGSVPEPRA